MSVGWSWVLPPVSGPCERCKEMLLKHRDGLVLFQGSKYHLHCLLDKLTESLPEQVSTSMWNGI